MGQPDFGSSLPPRAVPGTTDPGTSGKALTVRQAVERCSQLTREHSSTFFLGSKLFVPKKRRAVRVIYAACRSGDDAVDEVRNEAEAVAGLERWWQHIDRAFSGTPDSREPLEVALTWVLEHYPVPQSAFEELRLGLQADAVFRPPRNYQELLLYCRRVAGVVGLLVAPIAGYRGGQQTLDYAVALGNAMQLTNILRDVGEDLARGRCYLPGDLMADHDVSVEELRAGRVGEGYISLLEDLSARAHDLYRIGWRGIPLLRGTAAAAVGVAALNYEGILLKLSQNRYDNLNRRAHLKPFERIALIPKALASIYAR